MVAPSTSKPHPDFDPPSEWQRKVDLRCTGMTIHSARQHLAVLIMIWDESERLGWTPRLTTLYAEQQVCIRALLAKT